MQLLSTLSCTRHCDQCFTCIFPSGVLQQLHEVRTSNSIFPMRKQASVVASPAQLEVMPELGLPVSSPAHRPLMTWCSLPVFPASPPLHSGRPGLGLSCHQQVPGAHAGLACGRCSVNIYAKNKGLRCSACRFCSQVSLLKGGGGSISI